MKKLFIDIDLYKKKKKAEIGLTNNRSGLFSMSVASSPDKWIMLQLITPSEWKEWGYETIWYDGLTYLLSLGPLVSISWSKE